MNTRLQPILTLLDDGISLYRRHFVAFVLIAAMWLVPVAISVGLVVAAASWLEAEPGWATLLVLVMLVLLLPLAIYLVGGLSRGAMAAIEQRPVRPREALAIRPSRAASMGCFMLLYSIVMQMASSMLSMACICPLYLFGFAAAALVGPAVGSSAVGAIGLALFGVLFAGIYLFVLIVGGAGYSSLIYAIQPWVQEALPFGASFQRSVDLISYRFWRNLVIWGVAAILIAAVGLTITIAIGTLLPLPLVLALGAESPIAQAVTASAWVIGLVLVLPPLPIWMALLYKRNSAEREGVELEARVQEWMRSGD